MGCSAYLSYLVLLIGTSYLAAVFRGHHFFAVQMTYYITVLSCVLAAAVSPQFQQSLLMIMFSLLLIFTFSNMEINNFSMFSVLLDAAMNKRVHTHELKHFIGNVSEVRCGIREGRWLLFCDWRQVKSSQC